MIYPIIILLVSICTIVTLFLIKESFRSDRKKLSIFTTLIATCITIIFTIVTILYSFQESEHKPKNNINTLQTEIEHLKKELDIAQNEINQYQNKNMNILDNSKKSNTQNR